MPTRKEAVDFSDIAIGIAQWLPVCGDPARNLRDALAMVDRLVAGGSELVVLPELWPCGYDPATLESDAWASTEPVDGPRGQALSAAARRHGIWLFAGTVPEEDGGVLYNSAVVYGPDGALKAVHRKLHLYTPLGEDTVFSPGSEATVVDVEGLGPVGLSTCFDGDHPSYARRLNELGARVVVAPCAYEAAAESWWDLLYPANALVNGQWWIMANQVGGALLGKSRVIAPDGSVRAQASRLTASPAAELLMIRADLRGEVQKAQREAAVLWASGS
ncbi:carbon-nitrogen hydrolase family protein [Gryllotalpicola koreensis]|uniref:Carbon-nitrogen family hydrolase n=1 Tax=Gryllotalpicola koreensis TaxID=993086 RepID=A0ABP7ZZF0_9MICO